MENKNQTMAETLSEMNASIEKFLVAFTALIESVEKPAVANVDTDEIIAKVADRVDISEVEDRVTERVESDIDKDDIENRIVENIQDEIGQDEIVEKVASKLAERILSALKCEVNS